MANFYARRTPERLLALQTLISREVRTDANVQPGHIN
jgi:hypothetical protein